MARISVIGAGTMGNGIAQVFAQAGDEVRLIDVNREQVERGLRNIEKNLQRSVDKGRLTPEERNAVLERLTTGERVEDAADAELVVEAIFESLEAKTQVFATLDAACETSTILASNTSSISITSLAAATRRPELVVGMHFFNPVPVMKLVEVVRGLATSDETHTTVTEHARRLGKEPVEVRDFPGFVSNRVLMPMINEAAFALYEGVAGRDEIDTVMKLGMSHPMGPLELADFIGLDVCLSILDVLQDGFGDPKYRACPLLRQMVAAGRLGRKSGRGFYEYAG